MSKRVLGDDFKFVFYIPPLKNKEFELEPRLVKAMKTNLKTAAKPVQKKAKLGNESDVLRSEGIHQTFSWVDHCKSCSGCRLNCKSMNSLETHFYRCGFMGECKTCRIYIQRDANDFSR
jgi:hypothetical protein